MKIEALTFDKHAHPLLGTTTASVTIVFGGQNINSVLDAAGFTVDFRTVPSHDHQELVAPIQQLCGQGASIEIVTDFKGFATAPDDAALEAANRHFRRTPGRTSNSNRSALLPDASALVSGFNNVATVVIGPGEAAQCHQTDEFCYVVRIDEATEMYGELIRRMCS